MQVNLHQGLRYELFSCLTPTGYWWFAGWRPQGALRDPELLDPTPSE
jgi:hypothetical protein